jgi:hypothetical protein
VPVRGSSKERVGADGPEGVLTPVVHSVEFARRRKAAWGDPAMLATPLVLLYYDTFGARGFSWDPEVIKDEVELTAGLELPRGNLHRLLAGITLRTTDRFYRHLDSFVALCNVLSGDHFDPSRPDEADAFEVAWGITEALILAPPGQDLGEEPFADSVCQYVRAAAEDEGLLEPPDVLRLGGVPEPFRSDDPAEEAEVLAAARARAADLRAALRDRLELLLGQVEALPLEHGNAKALAQGLRGPGRSR